MDYTAEDYKGFIAELLEDVSDTGFLRKIYSIIAIWKSKRTGD